jgi:hypothetical protein
MLPNSNSHLAESGEQILLLQSSYNIQKERAMRIQFVIGILIILLATCSIQEASPADSGLEGQVLLGPVCPLVTPGQECSDQPYPTMLTVNSSDGRTITRVQTDQQGRFRLALKPGQYVLHAETPNAIPSAGDQAFTVEAGRYTPIFVKYDSGIR